MLRRFAGVAVLPFLLRADSLSPAERDFAIKNLRDSQKLFLDAVAHLSERQWSFKPGPNRWSIAEIAEHLALSEDKLFELSRESLKANGPGPGSKKPTDEAVMKFMTDRTIKAQAPASLQPTHALDKDALIARFTASRERNIAYIRETRDDLRHHYTDGPLGAMDAYQTLIGMPGHCEKHVGQMRDVMASRGFPRR
jgi:hypothetical protein